MGLSGIPIDLVQGLTKADELNACVSLCQLSFSQAEQAFGFVDREISELVRLYTGVKVDMSKALKGQGKTQKKVKKKVKKKAAKGQGGKGEL